MHDSQFGFTIVRSTSMALLNLIGDITTSLDNKKCTAGVFIDLMNTFDTIDQNILSQKLNHHDILGVVSDCNHSYLSNHKQFFYFN